MSGAAPGNARARGPLALALAGHSTRRVFAPYLWALAEQRSGRTAADYGASAPVAEDLPMPITLRRHRRFDGRLAYSAHRFDGSQRYAGQFTHFGNSAYSGDVVTLLEA